MKHSSSFFLAAATLVAASTAHAADVTKASSGTNLFDAASWLTGVPGAGDVATWGTNSNGAGLTLDSNVTWGSINITDAAENIGISGTGVITTGNITLAGTKTLTIGNNIARSGTAPFLYNIGDVTSSIDTDATFSGTFTGTGEIRKTGAGTLVLSGNNSGLVTGIGVNGGVLSVSVIADSGTTSQIGNSGAYLGVGDGGTFRYTGTTAATTSRALWMGSGDGTIEVVDAGASLTFTTTTGGAIRQRLIKTGAGALTIARGITDQASPALIAAVTVEAGSLTLNGANSYSGTTIVNGGSLTLMGANSKNSATSVNGGTFIAANLNAIGKGALTINGGNFSTSVANVNTGALTISNAASNVTLNSTGVGTITLATAASLALSNGLVNIDITGASTFDKILGNGGTGNGGTFSLTGGTLALAGFSGFEGTGGIGNSYALFTNFAASGNTVSGLTITGYDTANWSATINASNGNLVFTAVPEPGAALLGGLGLLALLRRRRA